MNIEFLASGISCVRLIPRGAWWRSRLGMRECVLVRRVVMITFMIPQSVYLP